MAIGVEVANLDAAVTEVINMAATRGQTEIRNLARSAQVDLTNRNQVREYLKDRVKESFISAKASPEGIRTAHIEDIPYRGLGFVFEQHHGAETHPPLEHIDGDGEFNYCAVFWTNVSR